MELGRSLTYLSQHLSQVLRSSLCRRPRLCRRRRSCLVSPPAASASSSIKGASSTELLSCPCPCPVQQSPILPEKLAVAGASSAWGMRSASSTEEATRFYDSFFLSCSKVCYMLPLFPPFFPINAYFLSSFPLDLCFWMLGDSWGVQIVYFLCMIVLGYIISCRDEFIYHFVVYILHI